MFDIFDYLIKNPDIYITFGHCESGGFAVAITDGRYTEDGIVTAETAQQIIDRMVAVIGKKRAKHYGNLHVSRQLRERERFFRNQ